MISTVTMLDERASGILLHPTSLPGPHGIGDLGQGCIDFIDYLASAKQTLWQVLPLGPTGYGDSPYASFSSFAGNPLLISLERLAVQGYLDQCDVEQGPSDFPAERVDYGRVIDWKLPLLRRAAETFRSMKNRPHVDHYQRFCQSHAHWLEDYALFMAIKNRFDEQARNSGVHNSVWSSYWERDIARREQTAIAHWREVCRDEMEIQKIWQYFFFEQWLSVKQYANRKGIQIIGDLPIYVALDSADVWSSPDAFRLDRDGRPEWVAGVPPDYFSQTGQRWGNPVYDWDRMKQDRFQWWVHRFQGTHNLVDIIRVDHFRGFEAGWSIPAHEDTAIHGEWVKAPGMELFQEVRQRLGELPILAEDLGLITPEVEHLRDANRFPGMKVLQFAFDAGPGPDNQFLPHNYLPNSVAYTGTHDNDTTVGWYATRNDEQRSFVAEYLGFEPREIAWDFIRLVLSSVSRLAIIPMQDVLSLGNEARMNMPASAQGNWAWRLPVQYNHLDAAPRLARLVELYDRA